MPARGRPGIHYTEMQLSGRRLLLDGEPVALGARAFDVLQRLVQDANQVVSKQELIEAAWPGLVVEENNLQVQISNLRRILGHGAITTVTGLGYQLTLRPQVPAPGREEADPSSAVPVESGPPPAVEIPSPPAPLPSHGVPVATMVEPKRRSGDHRRSFAMYAIAAMALLAVLLVLRDRLDPLARGGGDAAAQASSLRSVAVLPFLDMSEKKNLAYFSEGVAEEVLHLLSKVPELHVAARTSSFAFRDSTEDLRSIGRRLQVGTVLEGSVRQSGNSLRITAELVRSDNGFRIWSQTYDRTLGDAFQIQEEVAADVVQTLQVSLLGQQVPASMDDRRREAYALYLQGRSLQNHAGTQADWDEVDEYARRAISADVQYAPAWAFFARELEDRASFHWTDPGEAAWEAARQAATRSLSIDPDLREARVAIARIALHYDWNWAMAREQLAAIVRDDAAQADAIALQASLDLITGATTSAIDRFERAVSLDPLDPNQRVQLGEALLLEGRYSDAQIVLRKALSYHDGQALAHWNLGRIALANGDANTALAEFDSEPQDPARLAGRVIALARMHRRIESDAALSELRHRYARRTPVFLALALAARGEREEAFAALDSAIQARDTDCLKMGQEPLLAQLRTDPRFAALLGRIGLPVAKG